VAGNQVVGIAQMSTGFVSYQATINLNPRISNVISGNLGNGVGIYGGTHNQIAMNNIGTDATGTLGRGNARNGILLTRGASDNLIGGPSRNPQAGPNDRPPQANLIAGNRGEAIHMGRGADGNTMIGNLTP
jgi:hypothetical protein